LTDGERALDRLGKAAKDAGARSFHGGAVFLTPSALQVFLPLLERHFPLLAPLYREQFAQSAYLGRLTRTLCRSAAKDPRALRVGCGNARLQPELWVEEQGVLFQM